jgi:putative ABC transport system permease protein
MTVDDQVGMIKTFFDIILIVFSIFGGIALLAASIGIINTLFMSVQERTREIGLMKAMGLSSAKVFLSFSLEAISLGFWGSALGITLSIITGHVANTIFHEPGGFLESFPTFNLTEFTFANCAVITLLIMLIAFLAGTLPAVKAARKNPIDSLRYE